MEIVERGKTPEGYGIQIEDWSRDFRLAQKVYVAAIFKPATRSFGRRFGPKEGKEWRFAFECATCAEAKSVFDALSNGADARDFGDKLNNPEYQSAL